MGWEQAAMAGMSLLGDSQSSDMSQTQTGTWNQEIAPGQMPYLRNLWNQAGGLYGSTLGGMQGQIPGAVGNMQDIFSGASPYWQQQLQGGAYSGTDFGNLYNQALQTGGGNEQFINQSIMGGAGNDYVDAMKQQMQSDAFGRLSDTFNMYDLRASGNNLPGSSRHGILQARAAEDEMDRLERGQTALGYSTFDTDLNRKLGIAQRADQYDMERLQNIGNMWGQQQGAMSGGLGMGSMMQNLGMGGFAPYMMPWQAMSNYANVIGRPTLVGSGSSGAVAESESGGGIFGK